MPEWIFLVSAFYETSLSSHFECYMGQMEQIKVITWVLYEHLRWGFKGGVSVKYYARVLNTKFAGWW